MKRSIILALLIFIISIPSYSYNITGIWDGNIEVLQKMLVISVTFIEEPDSISGYITIPQQMAKNLPLTNITHQDSTVHFELMASPGNIASFQGILSKDTDANYVIIGEFTQMGFKGKFDLKFTSLEREVEEITAQEVEEVPNYRIIDVMINNNDVNLAGTLTIPFEEKKYPAVVMLTGSGPQDRDEDIFGFKIFKIIADYLTLHGYAVLRMDDRGVGGSNDPKGVSTTTFDFVDDAMSAFRFLKKRDEIDPDKIGLFGHSEGAITAAIAASEEKDIAFIIMLAGPGIRGDSLLLAQMEASVLAIGKTNEDVDEAQKWQKMIFSAIRGELSWGKVKESMIAEGKSQIMKLPEEQRGVFTDSMLSANVDLQLKSAKSKWMKEFIDIDPAEYLRKVKCPVLAIFGERDTQVPALLNKQAVEKALVMGDNNNYRMKIFKKANHLFQEAETGSYSEYMELQKQFVPGLLPFITDWLDKTIAPKK